MRIADIHAQFGSKEATCEGGDCQSLSNGVGNRAIYRAFRSVCEAVLFEIPVQSLIRIFTEVQSICLRSREKARNLGETLFRRPRPVLCAGIKEWKRAPRRDSGRSHGAEKL